MDIKNIISMYLNYSHNISRILILLGIFVFLLPKEFAQLYIYIVPITVLSWFIFDNKCIVTELEKTIKPKDNELSLIQKIYIVFVKNNEFCKDEYYNFRLNFSIIVWLLSLLRYYQTN